MEEQPENFRHEDKSTGDYEKDLIKSESILYLIFLEISDPKRGTIWLGWDPFYT